MECRYYASHEPERDRRDGIVYVTADSWLPSPDAVWTEVKGDIPCVVSCATADSESVKIKLEKGFSIPVVLKNAGMEQEGGKAAMMWKLCWRWKLSGRERGKLRQLAGTPADFI